MADPNLVPAARNSAGALGTPHRNPHGTGRLRDRPFTSDADVMEVRIAAARARVVADRKRGVKTADWIVELARRAS